MRAKFRSRPLGDVALAVAFALAVAGVAPTVQAQDELPPELAALQLLEERVELRDGVHLVTDVYVPPGDGPFPTLYTPTPYNSRQDPNSTLERMMAARGYAVVHQNVRGRFGSEGKFSPFLNETPDLLDSVEWILAQPWCDGNIGLIGSSSQSYSNQVLASTQHPALKALVNLSGLTNPWEVFFPGGAFRLDTLYPWMQFFYLGKPIRDMEEWQRRFRHRPMAENFEWGADLYYEMARNVVDVQKIQTPALHVTGWNDVVYRQSFFLYEGIPDAVEQRLVVGPWMHNQIGSEQTTAGDENYGPEAAMTPERLVDLVMSWFDRHLKGVEAPRGPAVRTFVMDGGGWQDYEQWPPASAVTQHMYLDGVTESEGVGSLQREIASGATTSTFVFDPDDPVLTFGGVNSHIFRNNAGPRDQSRFDERSDVLRFATAPAATVYALAGPMKVVLYAATDARDTDFTVKLSVMRADGYVRVIEDGIVRARYRNGHEDPRPIEPGAVVRYEIDLGQTALRIEPGQRLRVDVSSSNFPKYDLNPNTGEDAFTAVRVEKATQTIHHSAEYPSELVVTIVK